MWAKKYILLFCFLYLSLFEVEKSFAFLGEDLWLDMYKQVDEGFYELEKKQYEYEMTGQGETSVSEVVWPILAWDGINCDIASVDDIEKLLWNTDESDTLQFIVERCGSEEATTPNLLVEQVQNSLWRIRNDFSQRAQEKSQQTYEVARIGLYSDGNTENSPFDLITDLEEIDKIIFSEELEYNGENAQDSFDETLDDFLEEDKSYLYEEEDEIPEEENEGDDDNTLEDDDDIPPVLLDTIEDHKYVCEPGDDLSGLDDDSLDDILTGIEWSWSGYTSVPRTWLYPGPWPSNGASWGWPFPAIGPEGSYSEVRDEWPCGPDEFFCIIIEFQSSDYWLAGGNTMAIDKILEKASKHLEKPANASLTQRKMTTNNFELGSIIKNLPDMLRGLGVEVQTKPIPILDVPNESGEELVTWGIEEVEKLICVYYKNAGLDCERANDIGEYASEEEVLKVLQTSAGMPTPYVERRSNELSVFQTALRENNRIIENAVDQQILYDDMKDFWDQFTELEKFVAAMEDFVKGLKGTVTEMKKIPTRSS